MKEILLKTIIDLIRIPSVSGNESEIEKVLEYCKEFFKNKKLYIREFQYENAAPVMLISNHKKNDFDVLVVGHLDVVPAKTEQFEPYIKEGLLYGRGSSDMKGQIGIAMHLMNYIYDEKLPIKFGILITTDEETTSNGVKAFAKKEDIHADIVLDYDAGNLNTIIEKYKHSVGVKLTFKGVAGHSSRPWLGINAIEELIKVISNIGENFGQYSKQIGEPNDTWVDTMAVTSFISSNATNVIPEEATAIINFRLTDKMSLEDLKEVLDTAIDNKNCHYDIFMASRGCYMDASNKIIQDYKKLAEEILGTQINITHMHGATDARMIVDNSVIIMHSIDGANVHNDNEYADINSIIKFFEIQKKFITSLI